MFAQSGNRGAGGAVIDTVFLFYCVAGFAWPGLNLAYVAEILPSNIRAEGLVIGFACTSASSVLYFLFVETKGPTLEEIAKLFDGEDAAAVDKRTIESRLYEKLGAAYSSHLETAK